MRPAELTGLLPVPLPLSSRVAWSLELQSLTCAGWMGVLHASQYALLQHVM